MRPKINKISLLAMLLAVTSLPMASVQAQNPIIPSTYALPSSAADTSKPGFLWRMSQVDSVGTFPQNSLARTEAQLAGLLGPNVADPTVAGVASGPAAAPNPPSAPIEFTIPGVINVSKTEGTTLGNFTPDDQMPGSPNPTGGTDNQAAEILTWLDLPAGDIKMGVNSDDGFRMSIGGADPSDHFAVNVGQYDSGRGAGDTIFKFHIAKAGLYATRIIWENGGGDANIEFFSVPSAGNTNLVNDTSTAEAIKAYRAATVPPHSYASTFSPAPASTTVSPNAGVNIVLVDGPKAIVPATVQLTLDGIAVNATVTRTNNQTTIRYQNAVLWGSVSTHFARLVYSDNGSPAQTTTNDWSFTVVGYRNVALPTPIYFEDFEKSALGVLPAGWTVTNATDSLNAGLNIDDAKSDSYLDWVVIDRNQVFVNGDPNNPTKVWEEGDPDGRVTHIAPGQIENGKLLTADDLMVGKFLFAESDERGQNQVQVVFSSNYDLTGKSNIWLSYHSSYMQNQDSLGAVEYSVDGGTNWLPVLYMLDVPDIVLNADGTVDAVTTLTQDEGDAAYGQPYGTFIGAPVTAELGRYISGRINDDYFESHRVELFPLPAADNKAKVQLRFTQTGTGSWYFGIDNVGLYSISKGQPKVTGQWDFDQGDLRATVGQDMQYGDQLVKDHTSFGTTTSFGIPDIGGKPAKVMKFTRIEDADYPDPTDKNPRGYLTPDGMLPNGNGTKVNQFTMIVDMMIPDLRLGDKYNTVVKWEDVFTDDISRDGSISIQGNDKGGDNTGGIGISGQYSGDGLTYIIGGQWQRIVVAVDMAADTPIINYYIDGVKFGQMTTGDRWGFDKRHAIPPVVQLYGDGENDNEVNTYYVNSVQFRDGTMTEAEAAALGAASADGIPNPNTPAGGAPTISIARSATDAVITYTGTLEAADAVNGPWNAVTGATSPRTVSVTSAAAKFYRSRQ